MIVQYWSDFLCPFCYIAATRMKKALKELELEEETKVVFRAFELYPTAKKEPHRNIVDAFARHYGMTPEQAQQRVDYICEMGRGEGLVFNYGTAYNTNSFDALRLAKLAQSKGNDFGNVFVERMYKAFFEENIIVADHDALTKVAVEVGMDPAEVKEVLEGDRYAMEVRRDESEAQMYGISAVPFFVINDKYGIPGAVDTKDFKRILMKAYAEEEQDSNVSGMVCGPDGCHPADNE